MNHAPPEILFTNPCEEQPMMIYYPSIERSNNEDLDLTHINPSGWLRKFMGYPFFKFVKYNADVWNFIIAKGNWTNLSVLEGCLRPYQLPYLASRADTSYGNPERAAYKWPMTASYVPGYGRGDPVRAGYVLVDHRVIGGVNRAQVSKSSQIALLSSLVQGLIFYGWYLSMGRDYTSYDRRVAKEGGSIATQVRAWEVIGTGLNLGM